VLLEPSYEFGAADARARIEANGYVRGLPETARALGLEQLRRALQRRAKCINCCAYQVGDGRGG